MRGDAVEEEPDRGDEGGWEHERDSELGAAGVGVSGA